ncbi:hypothetical protein ACEPPN_001371 [Leptodophora sp. 'Broadleaf-Isolate-01']
MNMDDYYRARGIDAGTAEILEIGRNNPEVAGWPKYLREAEFQQCDACKKLDFDELGSRKGYNLLGVGQKHHESWDHLKKAAEAGCHTCRLIHMVKLHDNPKNSAFKITNGLTHLRIEREHSSVNIHGEGTRAPKLAWSTLPDCPGDKLGNKKENGGITFRFVEDNPASDEAFSREKAWIRNCSSEHPYCRNNDNVLLPSRVLDLEEATSTGQVKLIQSEGQLGKYIALSHCWGGVGGDNEEMWVLKPDQMEFYKLRSRRTRTCTTSNYEALKAGFSVSRIPRNFQDAITVATQLGIRYLWIDSFCIIQDSPDDWSHESLLMSEVYGNSFLTIYASAADNSDQGFLRRRDPERYLMTKLCPIPMCPEHWVWIRWPPSDLVWSFDDALGRLWDRSWAFQELVLPSRVLDYGRQMLNWRCNHQHIEESSKTFQVGGHDGYKELMWILSLPEVNSPPTSGEVPSHPTFAAYSDKISIYSRWYQLIEGFAGRQLTNELDKLPAISGLANKIQRIAGDVYMAGLWKKDIAAGLCWGARFNGALKRPSAYIAPSWSWASTQGFVTHQFEDERKFEIELVNFKLETEPLNPLGQVFSGSITICGPVRRFNPTQSTIHIKEEWDHEAEKLKPEVISDGKVEKHGGVYQYAMKDQKDVVDPLGSGICSLSMDFGSPTDVAELWLLKLAVRQAGEKPLKPNLDSTIPDGIILEKSSGDEEICRRIGVFGCSDAMADWIVGPQQHAALLGWGRKTITIV